MLFLDGKVTLHAGDCLDVLATLPENSVDSCVTDPPYHLTSIVKRFGAENSAPVKAGKTGAYKRASAGFMGKAWDGGDVAFRPETWAAVYRVLKPGAHLVAFGGSRTYHRLACAIEDAGFEIRDQVQWLFGSGFPKSHDVSKGIDRAAGAEREKIRHTPRPETSGTMSGASDTRPWIEQSRVNGFHEADGPVPATAAAAAWSGWGTALKPACEPIVLARKPLSEGTVAANVLKWGTGALNIDGCRIATDEVLQLGKTGLAAEKFFTIGRAPEIEKQQHILGRWPANVIHDGSEEVVGGFPAEAGGGGRDSRGRVHQAFTDEARRSERDDVHPGHNDSGSAARFFYTAKADSDDRLGSKHPTVKPLDLMQYLVRLVTPKGGTVLDCFAGTGTTGEAAWREGFKAILIEREAKYQNDIRRRMDLALAGPTTRRIESAKARGVPDDRGTLFERVGAA